jgi:anti-anti-sigma factor
VSQPAEAELSSVPHAGPLTLTAEDSGTTRLLRLAGDLDLATVDHVTVALDLLDVHSTTLLVLDLRELAFLDLAGLTAILRADEYCKSHRIRLTVIKPRGFAGRVFTLTGVHRDLELVNPPAPG